MSGLRRDPRISAQLDLWALWSQRGGYGGGATSPLARLIDSAAGCDAGVSAGSAGPVVPLNEIECSRVDDAVRALPPDLREAVHAWHLAREGTMEGVARRMGMVKTTLHRRLCHADIRIREHLVQRVARSVTS